MPRLSPPSRSTTVCLRRGRSMIIATCPWQRQGRVVTIRLLSLLCFFFSFFLSRRFDFHPPKLRILCSPLLSFASLVGHNSRYYTGPFGDRFAEGRQIAHYFVFYSHGSAKAKGRFGWRLRELATATGFGLLAWSISTQLNCAASPDKQVCVWLVQFGLLFFGSQILPYLVKHNGYLD